MNTKRKNDTHERKVRHAMLCATLCLVLLGVSPATRAQDLSGETDEATRIYTEQFTGEWDGPELINGIPRGSRLVHGDILIPEQELALAAHAWPEGIVYFQFDANVNLLQRAFMLGAMDVWNASNADVVFLPRNGQSEHVHVRADLLVNNSSVGRQGGEQIINISLLGFLDTGLMVHELTHALGFWHEQSRPDRDDRVIIIDGNICQTCCGGGPCDHNFDIVSKFAWLSLNTAYDFGSLMHYGQCDFTTCASLFNGCFGFCPCTFCSNNEGRTIVCKPGFEQFQSTIGTASGLSASDIQDMADAYGSAIPPKFVDSGNFLDFLFWNGSLLHPYSSFASGANAVTPGGTVWVKGGTYSASGRGTFSNPATWKSYPGWGMVSLGG